MTGENSGKDGLLVGGSFDDFLFLYLRQKGSDGNVDKDIRVVKWAVREASEWQLRIKKL